MDKHGWLFKASLLSIATLTNAAAAVQVTIVTNDSWKHGWLFKTSRKRRLNY